MEILGTAMDQQVIITVNITVNIAITIITVTIITVTIITVIVNQGLTYSTKHLASAVNFNC